jgi:hypothetical protein
MEVFLALITDDFHVSIWTNQEIGFAKARHIPIISLKLGRDPQGFIADKQALKGDIEWPDRSSSEIFKLLADKLRQRDRLQGAIITAFCDTPNWNEARSRFDEMSKLVDKLLDEELSQIKAAFAANDQLHKATYLSNGDRLLRFLERTTGTKFELKEGTIRLPEMDEEIPF